MDEKNLIDVDESELALKPLSKNPVLKVLQKLYRWWLGVWCSFKANHPKSANLAYMIFFFIVFSEGVTIWQYVVMTFLPYAFAGLGTTTWGWAPFQIMGVDCTIFGDTQGLGYFIAFELAVFTAQCINFPLQRNITYRSHGNVWYQAMWYFIGWLVISVLMNVIWGIVNCFCIAWGIPDALTGLVKTFLTGGVSMVVFFFIFLVIFPDVDKEVKNKEEALKKATTANVGDKEAENELKKAVATRDRYHAEKAIAECNSITDAKISAYLGLKKVGENGKVTKADIEKARKVACEAVLYRKIVIEKNEGILKSII